MGIIAVKRRKFFFRTLDNLWKFAEIMDVCDETHIIHLCYAAGWENISAIFLGVQNTFWFTREGSCAMTSKLPQSW